MATCFRLIAVTHGPSPIVSQHAIQRSCAQRCASDASLRATESQWQRHTNETLQKQIGEVIAIVPKEIV